MLDFHYFFVGGLRFNENTYKLKLPTVKQLVGVQFFGKNISTRKKLGFLFGFHWFLFSRLYSNIEESKQVFCEEKS